MDIGDSAPYILGGGLPDKYRLVQFHFHWSQSNDEGSETQIQGVQYPLEVCLKSLLASVFRKLVL